MFSHWSCSGLYSTNIYLCDFIGANFTDCSFCLNLVVTGSLKMSSSDCEVLHALYQVTDGQKWQNESNWDTGDDISLWYGVTVRGGRVVKLLLGHIWSGSRTHQGNNLSAINRLSSQHRHLSFVPLLSSIS